MFRSSHGYLAHKEPDLKKPEGRSFKGERLFKNPKHNSRVRPFHW